MPDHHLNTYLIQPIYISNHLIQGEREPKLSHMQQGGVTPIPSVLTSETAVKLGQYGKWPLTFDFR